MLKELTIKRLFARFDYQIEINEGGITIITGPNGYGKTTILKIIYSIITKNIIFLINLPFLEINLTYADNTIVIKKNSTDDDFFYINNNKSKVSFKSIKKAISSLENTQSLSDYSRKLIYQLTNDDTMRNSSVGLNEINLFDEKFSQLLDLNPSLTDKLVSYEIKNNVQAFLIKEQRLFNTLVTPLRKVSEYEQFEKIVTIKRNAYLLSEKLMEYQLQSDKIGRENESSYVQRLLSTTNTINKDEFDKRFSQTNKIKQTLSKFGLYSVDRESPTTFKDNDAKALSIFLDDTEKKLVVFELIIKQLELFTYIINKKEFTDKKLVISPVDGYIFIDTNSKKIELDNLSSGEQHELILIYELIFKIGSNAIVLIDEPEISLHVVWQKEFLKDLKAIIALNGSNVIVATHSPQIINNEWDKTIDLYAISHKE